MLAFLYAGQGSQKEKMGEDFYSSYPQVRDVFDNPSAGFDIADTCFRANIGTLTQTKYTQACMAAFGAAVTKLLFEQGIQPDYAAGLSLGEYSALFAAGVFDVDTMLSLLAYRGKIMEETTAGLDTKMAAVIGLTEEQVILACDKAAHEGLGMVSPANFNSAGQIVIGGGTIAVDKAIEFCNELGARRCLPLNVSAPFHTPYMEEASLLMGEALVKVKFGEMKVPVIHNATADFLKDSQTVASLLEVQIKMPVLFQKTIEKLAELSVTTVIEIGPGNVISGFIKKTAPSIAVYSIEDVESFKKVIAEVK